jgi:hypothetical protein
MSEKPYPLTVEEIESWFRSKEAMLASRGVTLAGVRTSRRTNKPAATADFDTAQGIGNITIWVSGETDFVVLQTADGKSVFVRHEVVSSLDSPDLESVFRDFVGSILHPESAISRVA